MEVQPINIQLNTSTDEESETETNTFQDTNKTQQCNPAVPTRFTTTHTDTCIPYNIVQNIERAEGCESSENIAAPIGDVKPSPEGDKTTSPINPKDVQEFIPSGQQFAEHLLSDGMVRFEGVTTRENELVSNEDVSSVMLSDIAPSTMIFPGIMPSPMVQSDMTPQLEISMVAGANHLMYDMNNAEYTMSTQQYPTLVIDPTSQYYNSNAALGGYNMVENPMESKSIFSESASPTYDPTSAYRDQCPELSPSDAAVDSRESPVATPVLGSELGQDVLPSQALVFPSLYVSSAGLLTVFLRHDVAVEMTLDRAIRVVNNRHRAVAATNNSGNCSCIHHPAAKIYQEDSTVETELFWERRAKLTSHRALFACGNSCFQLSENGMQCALPEFSELSNDMSVTLLFSSSGYGPQLTSSFQELVSNATYRYYKDGGISVRINGIKISQRSHGEVTVATGRKFIRASPVFGSMCIETPQIQMSVEMNWNVKIQREDYRLNASFAGLMVSDGTRECGFDQYQQVFIQPKMIRKQAIIRNGRSVTRSWGQHGSNQYNDRYHCSNRYYYNRYQNYCNMNYNNNSNNKYSGNQNRMQTGPGQMRFRNSNLIQCTYDVSSSSSSNSIHDSSAGTATEVN